MNTNDLLAKILSELNEINKHLRNIELNTISESTDLNDLED